MRFGVDATVKQELIDYWPLIRPGAILAGHDYCNYGEPSLPCIGCANVPRCQQYTSYGVARGKSAHQVAANQAGVVRAVHEWLMTIQSEQPPGVPPLRLHHTHENFTRASLTADALDFDLVITNTRNPSWFVFKPHALPPAHDTSSMASDCVDANSCGLGQLEAPWHPHAPRTAHIGLRSVATCEQARGFSMLQQADAMATINTSLPEAEVHTKTLTVALIYYASPALLLRHMAIIHAYTPAVLARLHLLLIDDGSPLGLDAARYINGSGGLRSLSVVRIEPDIAWNLGGARNLAMHLATTPRVMLIELDAPAPSQVMAAALELPATTHGVPIAHRFNRVRPDGSYKISPAAVLLAVESYWAAGGCDEDFVGNYGMTDSHFWYRAKSLPLNVLKIERHSNLVFTELSSPQGEPCEGVTSPHPYTRCMAAVTAHVSVLTGRSRDNAANALLLKWKQRTGRWSNEYLRFKWGRPWVWR